MLIKQGMKTRAARGGRRSVAVGAVAALALSLAACGGGDDKSEGSETAGVDFDSMSTDELYQAAQDAGEDEVMLYSVLSADDLAVIAEPFEKKYPGIKVKNYEGQGESVAAKLLEEAGADVHNADALDADQNTMYAIAQEDLLAEYAAPAAAEFDKQFKHPWFTGFRVQIMPIAYNTDRISEAEAPKDYPDLLDPKWEGQVCAEASNVAVFALMLDDWGDDEGRAFWEGLVDNGLRFISGQTTLIQSVIAGDCPIAVSANIHGIAPEREKGAPIDWVQTDPMYADYGAAGVAAEAPHPYAARLWINFLLTEGQQSLADNWRIPANPAVPPREARIADPASYNVVVAGDDIMERARELNDLYYTTTDRPVIAPE